MARGFMFLLALNVAAAATAAEDAGSRGAAAKGKTPAAASDLDLNGTWRGFVVAGKGENPNSGTVHLELTIQGNRIVAQRLDGQRGPLGQGTYTITTARYYQLDATESHVRGKPRVYLGICAFGPDLMRWCVATPGNGRPATFETKGQQFLLILRRQKADAAAAPAGKRVRAKSPAPPGEGPGE
jgi:hypothetical protein